MFSKSVSVLVLYSSTTWCKTTCLPYLTLTSYPGRNSQTSTVLFLVYNKTCTSIFEVPIEHTWCFRFFYSIRVITSVASLATVINSQLCDWRKLLVHIMFWSTVIKMKPLSRSYRPLCTHAHRIMRNKFQTCHLVTVKPCLCLELTCDLSKEASLAPEGKCILGNKNWIILTTMFIKCEEIGKQTNKNLKNFCFQILITFHSNLSFCFSESE